MTERIDKKEYTTSVSDSFEKTDENHRYEIAFRRWLVREIEEQRMTVTEAIGRFNFHPTNGGSMINKWRKKYAPELFLPLEAMTAEEKQKLAALQKRVKEMEKALDDARMRNIALNMLIDIAEKKLHISIRKKPGAKQS